MTCYTSWNGNTKKVTCYNWFIPVQEKREFSWPWLTECQKMLRCLCAPLFSPLLSSNIFVVTLWNNVIITTVPLLTFFKVRCSIAALETTTKNPFYWPWKNVRLREFFVAEFCFKIRRNSELWRIGFGSAGTFRRHRIVAGSRKNGRAKNSAKVSTVHLIRNKLLRFVVKTHYIFRYKSI